MAPAAPSYPARARVARRRLARGGASREQALAQPLIANEDGSERAGGLQAPPAPDRTHMLGLAQDAHEQSQPQLLQGQGGGTASSARLWHGGRARQHMLQQTHHLLLDAGGPFGGRHHWLCFSQSRCCVIIHLRKSFQVQHIPPVRIFLFFCPFGNSIPTLVSPNGSGWVAGRGPCACPGCQ
jgi:hypothetical protein